MTREIPTILDKIEEQAALYSLGMLSQTEARAFERELAEGNEDASARLRTFDRLVTDLSLGAPEAAPSAALRDRLLARITGEQPLASAPSTSPLPSPVPSEDRRKRELSSLASQFLSIRADEGEWRQMPEGAQVKILFVDRARDTVTSLVRLAPGGRLPRHRHHGAEESIVIEGDCRVNGDVLRPGDYRCAPDGSVDSEVTTEHGTMFLMVAPREIEVLEAGWQC